MLAGSIRLKTFLAIVAVGGLALLALLVAGFVALRGVVTPAEDPRPFTIEQAGYRPERFEAKSPAPAAAPAPPAAPEAAAPPAGQRDVDKFLLGWQGKALGSDKIKDASKGRPWKVNLYQDSGEATMNRAKVDLDRDDKWDEKWTFDGQTITRQVAPADDEAYTEKYHWDGGGWTPAS